LLELPTGTKSSSFSKPSPSSSWRQEHGALYSSRWRHKVKREDVLSNFFEETAEDFTHLSAKNG
jgi:hypothetical protein